MTAPTKAGMEKRDEITVKETNYYAHHGVRTWGLVVRGVVMMDGFRSEDDATNSIDCYRANFMHDAASKER